MSDTKQSKLLKSEVLELLRRWHPDTVSEILDMLHDKRGITVNQTLLSRVLKELANEGAIQFEAPSPRTSGLRSFLRAGNLSGDFWFIAGSLLVLDAIIFFPPLAFLSLLRWGLGALAILLFPGYSVQMCLFPGAGVLLHWKRVLLGIGLSVAVIGFYAVILDATSQGIVLNSVLIVVTAHTLIFSWIGLLRRYDAKQKHD